MSKLIPGYYDKWQDNRVIFTPKLWCIGLLYHVKWISGYYSFDIIVVLGNIVEECILESSAKLMFWIRCDWKKAIDKNQD